MPKFNHVSFDIETLDTTPTSVVLSIGTAKFNLEDDEAYDDIKEDNERCFYAALKTQIQIDAGRTINIEQEGQLGTLQWWMTQSKDAQKVFFENKYEVEQGLNDLTEFCKGTKYAWGNGNMFDNVIIRSLYNSMGMVYPYHYTRDMDLRTLKVAAGNPKISIQTSSNTKHNALDDAVFQAVLCQQFWKAIHGE